MSVKGVDRRIWIGEEKWGSDGNRWAMMMKWPSFLADTKEQGRWWKTETETENFTPPR
jgi:hypothetical protein